MNVWKIAPGDHASDWELFRDAECIGIGWLPEYDYRDFSSAAEVLASLEHEHGVRAKGAGKGAADMVWAFTNELNSGDIVVANDAYNRIVGVGRVRSNYIWPTSRKNPLADDETTHRHHIRRVDWLIAKPVDIRPLPSKKYFFVQQTLKLLRPDEAGWIADAYLSEYAAGTKLARQVVDLLGQPASRATRPAPDLPHPKTIRVECTTYRILRDTELARRVKRWHKFRCQICGDFIELTDGTRYAEAHHIKPLGGEHKGPDVAGNILCLCPNHHAECDYGTIRLSMKTLRHADNHLVDPSFIKYHNKEIFGKV